MCSRFLSGNDSPIKTHEYIQENKFNKLIKERQPKPDPEKVVFNYSDSLSDAEKPLSVEGLKISIPTKKLNYADYIVKFELFYRSIYNLDGMSNENLDFVKNIVKNAALTSFCNYNANLPRNLSNEEYEALQNLCKKTKLVIQKLVVVVLDKDIYIKHIESLLNNKTKFEIVDTKKGLLSFTLNHEKQINEYLKS